MPGTTRWIRSVAAVSLLAGLLAACGQTPVKPPRPVVASGLWGPEIQEASQRFKVPEQWIRAVMQVESGGQTHWKGGQPITSSAGAMGLMQVMPGTYDELRYAHGLGGDAYNPRDNIIAGTAYIREMYDLYGYPGFLGAYNAGPERYRQYVEEGRPLPRETRRYMDIISSEIDSIMPRGGPDRMTQYAAAQIRQQVPMRSATVVAAMKPIPDGSSYGTAGTTVVAAMKPIPDGSSYGTAATTVVAAMKPIPDGSSFPTVVNTVVAQMQPIPNAQGPVAALAARVAQPAPVRMQPIPDGSTQVAAVAPVARVVVVPAPVRMAPIPDGNSQVAAAAPVARTVLPAPVRMAPIPDAQPAARAPAPAEVRVATAAPMRAPARMAAAPVRVASAKSRGQTIQQVADASESPRRQSNGLPAGWFVPNAPGK